MQLYSPSTFQPRFSSKEAIPYSSAAMRQDLERVRGIWDDCQATRDRNAIYGYLSAVYGLVAWWTLEGRAADRPGRALRSQRLEYPSGKTPTRPSFGAPLTQPRPTNGPGANGLASCGTRQSTNRIP